MDIRELAYLIHSNWNKASGPKDGPLYTMDRKAYGDYLAEANEKRWTSGEAQKEFLYNGSETRAQLSDTEIAVLANKYDPHNMDQEAYDAFLDDLQSMGAISQFEKETLGYGGFLRTGYINAEGKLIDGTEGTWYCGGGPDDLPIRTREESDGDIYRWLKEMFQWERREDSNDPDIRKAEADYDELHRVLGGIVDRVQIRREEDAEEAEKAELVRQLADKDSDFYTNMRTALKAQVEKNDEDREEQAIIDAMAAVLDAMSGRETVAGEKTSVNKSASELTQKIGERISRLKKEDPENPEIVKLENMLARLQEMGIYIDLSDMDGLWQDEDETFEPLTQFLIRRQAEEIAHPNEKEVNEPA